MNLKKFYELDGIRVSDDDELWAVVQYRNRIIEKLIISKKGTLLDIGAGRGKLIIDLIKKGYKGIGLDISFTTLKRFHDSAEKLKILQICGDVTCLPFSNDSFQIILASEILEHLPDYNKGLKEVYRVLKSGGELIITVPYKERLREVICPYCYKNFIPHGHLHAFDEKVLKEILLSQGFQIQYISVICTKLTTFFLLKKIKIPLLVMRTLDYLSWKLDLPGGWLVVRVCK